MGCVQHYESIHIQCKHYLEIKFIVQKHIDDANNHPSHAVNEIQ